MSAPRSALELEYAAVPQESNAQFNHGLALITRYQMRLGVDEEKRTDEEREAIALTEKCFLRALEIASNHGRAMIMYGMLIQLTSQKTKYPKAIELLTKVTADHTGLPKDCDDWSKGIVTLVQIQMVVPATIEDSIKTCDRGLAQARIMNDRPTLHNLLYKKGAISWELKKLDDAIEAFSELKKISPNTSVPLDALLKQKSAVDAKALASAEQQAKDAKILASDSRPCLRALHDYAGSEAEYQLSFKKGDLIWIIDEVKDGWFEGELSSNASKKGYVPESYVERVKRDPAVEAQAMAEAKAKAEVLKKKQEEEKQRAADAAAVRQAERDAAEKKRVEDRQKQEEERVRQQAEREAKLQAQREQDKREEEARAVERKRVEDEREAEKKRKEDERAAERAKREEDARIASEKRQAEAKVQQEKQAEQAAKMAELQAQMQTLSLSYQKDVQDMMADQSVPMAEKSGLIQTRAATFSAQQQEIAAAMQAVYS